MPRFPNGAYLLTESKEKKNINYWITLINSTNWRFDVTFKNLFVIPRISLHGLHDKSTYSNKLLYP